MFFNLRKLQVALSLLVVGSYSSVLAPIHQSALVSEVDLSHKETVSLQMGVGMDLSSSYGTVSIAYPNGTTVDVVRIAGNQTYRDMMKTLSLDSSRHPAPPYRDLYEAIIDGPRQQRRRARKARGLPASENVAVISVMLTSLRKAAEEFLGHQIDAALVATPDLVALYREELEDAFEYISLKSLDDPLVLIPAFHEPSALAASHGVGLCEHPEEHDKCRDEILQMPDFDVLTVLYTRDALCVERSTMASVYWYQADPSVPTSMDFSLGSDARYDNPGEPYYMEAVKHRIMAGILGGYGNMPYKIEHLFLFGEDSNDHLLRIWLEETVVKVLGYMPQLHTANPIFAAARGAAEIARRGGRRAYAH